ncbi:hypothetical protein Pst134EB_010535 [Puccinia striiformis f. sp. tritici]|nr:hypothetical protein Pst134EB_010535 [Puccinia striiformis f. sp. tritici]
MVNTRRSKPALQGPLPPTTRAKRPKQTKAYKALLALPPLPPSPTEEEPTGIGKPSTSYGKLLPTPFRPQDDQVRQQSTPSQSPKSSTSSNDLESPNSPVLPPAEQTEPIDSLVAIIDKLDFSQSENQQVTHKLYSLTATPEASFNPAFERPPSPFLSKISHIYSEFLG